jgi:hypothetical protein
MKRTAILLIASAAVCSAPALAEDVVIKKSSPSVTVGSDTVVKEREVVREREPRSKVIVKEKNDEPVVEKKTIIKERD